ncbi:BET1 homolog isoform X2 [Monomorium pharaonis]|uniref:BET1 homolog isoform X2 n=1 Tax=Monomorium pharaonis TaxID=307658 RepID=UPI001745D68C|nr:BET1 homolog isoform X2 [Monomorium pharaonis]
MRRAHSGGYGYEPLPSTSTHNTMQDENERMTEKLGDKIQALKSLSIDIGTEVKYQEKMLKDIVSR